MAKLHELLAVEKSVETPATEAINEGVTTFSKKADHFLGWEKRYAPFKEGDQGLPAEHHELVTTVHQKLAFVFDHIVRWVDVVLQKESTNQVAKADIEINGAIIAKDVPATFLLGMEAKLKMVRALMSAAPTLAPGVKWVPDANLGDNIYRNAHADETQRTQKTLKYNVVVPATEHHPAQVKDWTEDVPIGRFITEKWCGMISPTEKSEFLARLDDLERAVKQARQRANATTVVSVNIGRKLTDYLLTGKT